LSLIDRIVTGIAMFARNHTRSKAQSTALATVKPPPPMEEIEPLRRHIELLAASANEVTARREEAAMLRELHEPPRLDEESVLLTSLAAIENASRQVVRWELKAKTFAAIAPAPPALDSSSIADLIHCLEVNSKLLRDCESATKKADRDLAAAAAEVRANVDGRSCPVCGSTMEAEQVIARAKVGTGGHNHG
jgi:hypothetical protein